MVHTEKIIHSCLNNCKKYKKCKTCSIFLNDYCDIFQKVSQEFDSKLKKKYSLLSENDRQDIISETVIGIIEGIKNQNKKNVEIKNPEALMRTIHRFKIIDHFRKQPNFSGNNEIVIDDPLCVINIDGIKKIAEKYTIYISWDGNYKTLKSISATLPQQLFKELLKLSDEKKWQQKVRNFYRFNNHPVIIREGDQKPIDDYSDPHTIEKKSDNAEERINQIITFLDEMQTKSAKACARLIKEYLEVLRNDGFQKDLAQIFGKSEDAIKQKMKRCRELIHKMFKGMKNYGSR